MKSRQEKWNSKKFRVYLNKDYKDYVEALRKHFNVSSNSKAIEIILDIIIRDEDLFDSEYTNIH